MSHIVVSGRSCCAAQAAHDGITPVAAHRGKECRASEQGMLTLPLQMYDTRGGEVCSHLLVGVAS